jgi:hypothetical protein
MPTLRRTNRFDLIGKPRIPRLPSTDPKRGASFAAPRRKKREMIHVAIIKVVVALVPASTLLAGSAVFFCRDKGGAGSVLQLIGAGCLVLVALTHVCEALHIFPWMHWGAEHSVGHYLDLTGAVLGISLFPRGYFVSALTRQPGCHSSLPGEQSRPL